MKKLLTIVLLSMGVVAISSGFDSKMTKKELIKENQELKVRMYDAIAKNDTLQRENQEYLESIDNLVENLDTAEVKIAHLSDELKKTKEYDGRFFSVIKNTDLPFEIQMYTYAISLEYDLEYPLLLAIMHKESSGKVDAVNRNSNGTKDSGLMQINSVNHEWLKSKLGITDFFDPYQNIRAGAYILRDLFNRYDDVHQVLMAYNMGETQMRKLVDKGVYSSKYSRAVVERMGEYGLR